MKPTPLEFNDAGDGWHLEANQRPARRGVFAVGAVLFLGGAGGTAWSREWGAAALMALIGCAFLLPLLARPRKPMSPRRHDGPEGTGLLIPTYPMRLSFVMGFAVFGSLMLGGGLWAGFRAILEEQPRMLLATLLGGAIGLLSLAGGWFGVRGRLIDDQGVLLTRAGVSLLVQSEEARTTVPWDEIRSVLAHWTRLEHKGPDTIRNWLTFESPGHVGPNPLAPFVRTNSPTVNANDLGVDPHTVLAVCRYYLAHPRDREELPTMAALDRVRRLGENGVPRVEE